MVSGLTAPATGGLWLRRQSVLFAAMVATGWLGIELPHWGGRVALWLLPSGPAVAAMIRWGRNQWIAILAAGIVLELGSGSAPIVAVLVASGLPAGAWLTARTVERYRFQRNFSRRADVPVFLAASLLGMALAALIGVGVHIVSGTSDPSDALPWRAVDALRWWLNAMAGVIALGPLLIALRANSFVPVRHHPREALLGLALILVLMTGMARLSPAAIDPGIVQLPLLVLSVALVVIVCLHFGLVPAASVALALSIAEALCFDFNWGSFHGLRVLSGELVMWAYMGALFSATLILTALLAERDAAGAARLRTELRYALAVAGAHDAIWDADLLSGESYFSPRFASLLDLDPQEDLPDSLTALTSRLHPEDQEPTQRAIQQHLESHEPLQVEVRLRTGSGAYRWFRVRAQSLWDEAGTATRIAGSISNIHEQRQTQESLRVSQERELQARRQFTHDLLTAQERERQRIANELHDSLGQNLALISNRAQMGLTGPGERAHLQSQLEAILQIVQDAIREVRALARNLRPFRVEELGLTESIGVLIDQLAEGSELAVEKHLENVDGALGPEASAHLYRIAQEALTNVLKHSMAKHLRAELQLDLHCVRLVIHDDGQGFDPDLRERSGSVGLHSISERADMVGGSVTFRTGVGLGTEFRVEIPLMAAEPIELADPQARG
ncbi:MAG: PAS domain-containing protein [Steroidobacteraceae bacterium]|jgi:PAS domain S-box-containing protein